MARDALGGVLLRTGGNRRGDGLRMDAKFASPFNKIGQAVYQLEKAGGIRLHVALFRNSPGHRSRRAPFTRPISQLNDVRRQDELTLAWDEHRVPRKAGLFEHIDQNRHLFIGQESGSDPFVGSLVVPHVEGGVTIERDRDADAAVVGVVEDGQRKIELKRGVLSDSLGDVKMDLLGGRARAKSDGGHDKQDENRTLRSHRFR